MSSEDNACPIGEGIGKERTPKERIEVLLYIPNIIDLLRVLFAFVAFSLMDISRTAAIVCYWISFSLDYLDGTFARKFNQVSKFGAMLDMVLDRVCTALLSMNLTKDFPKYCWFFQFFTALDISSHMFHIMRQQLDGIYNHKDIRSHHSKILLFYYKTRSFLGILCTFNEMFYLTLASINILPKWLLIICFILGTSGFIVKQAINAVQLASACCGIIDYDLRRKELKEKKTLRKE